MDKGKGKEGKGKDVVKIGNTPVHYIKVNSTDKTNTNPRILIYPDSELEVVIEYKIKLTKLNGNNKPHNKIINTDTNAVIEYHLKNVILKNDNLENDKTPERTTITIYGNCKTKSNPCYYFNQTGHLSYADEVMGVNIGNINLNKTQNIITFVVVVNDEGIFNWERKDSQPKSIQVTRDSDAFIKESEDNTQLNENSSNSLPIKTNSILTDEESVDDDSVAEESEEIKEEEKYDTYGNPIKNPPTKENTDIIKIDDESESDKYLLNPQNNLNFPKKGGRRTIKKISNPRKPPSHKSHLNASMKTR